MGNVGKLFYRGAHRATLDPLAARRPPSGLFMWSQQGAGAGGHDALRGHAPAAGGGGKAGAQVAYDVPHAAPWDWRVSLYTLTKGIAAGVYLVALLLLLAPGFTTPVPMTRFTTPVPMTWVVIWCMGVPLLGGLSLVVTGGLIWDLKPPRRFFLIFRRPQWRSWLVRGGFLIAGYGVVLALHVVDTVTHHSEWTLILAWLGAPLALATAASTACPFAQAKARDLWQNPLLPPHFAVQAVLAGAAALLPLAAFGDDAFKPVPGMTPSDLMSPPMLPHLLLIVAVASLLHLALVLGECTLTHGTAYAQLAVREMTRGRFRAWFWAGIALSAAGAAAPWIGAWAAAPALAGLFAFEHAYVQAGQSVPLA